MYNTLEIRSHILQQFFLIQHGEQTKRTKKMSSFFKGGISVTWLDNFCRCLINTWHCISFKPRRNTEKQNVHALERNTVV